MKREEELEHQHNMVMALIANVALKLKITPAQYAEAITHENQEELTEYMAEVAMVVIKKRAAERKDFMGQIKKMIKKVKGDK